MDRHDEELVAGLEYVRRNNDEFGKKECPRPSSWLQFLSQCATPAAPAPHLHMQRPICRRYITRIRSHFTMLAGVWRPRQGRRWYRSHTIRLDSEFFPKKGYFWLKFRHGVIFVKFHVYVCTSYLCKEPRK